MERREFLRLLAIAAASGIKLDTALGKTTTDLYQSRPFGQVRLLHFTDCHAQLLPVYYREPHVNIGVGPAYGKPPHIVGEALLKWAGISPNGIEAHAFSHLDFINSAQKFGKVGGFAHLSSLVKQLRSEMGEDRSLLLDGGDTWQGSGTSKWTGGQDMVGATNLLGVDIMTGHWEFTYPEAQILKNLKDLKAEFLAQNVHVAEEALFEGYRAYDADTGHAFKPYVIKNLKGKKIAILGQAFPYTPIANPARFIPNWNFGIKEAALQDMVDKVKAKEKPHAIILLSHNGYDVDYKIAGRVSGLDAILGGHTHDGIPKPAMVKNKSGKTLVANSGSNGKFLSVLDLDIGSKGIKDYRYRLLPVFSRLLPKDKEMRAYIDKVRAPYKSRLEEKLAVTESLLYRRGNFNGSFDQLIGDGLRAELNSQISLSPGFRWGTSLIPGQTITQEDILNQTSITYPETYARGMKGSELKNILEDVCDNIFNQDPYRQQGGDMVRTGGMTYTCDPKAKIGQRIYDIRLNNGKLVEANKTYKVAGWAQVKSKAKGEDIDRLLNRYLKNIKVVKLDKVQQPKLVNVKSNPGLGL